MEPLTSRLLVSSMKRCAHPLPVGENVMIKFVAQFNTSGILRRLHLNSSHTIISYLRFKPKGFDSAPSDRSRDRDVRCNSERDGVLNEAANKNGNKLIENNYAMDFFNPSENHLFEFLK